jgi:hypothetical protein
VVCALGAGTGAGEAELVTSGGASMLTSRWCRCPASTSGTTPDSGGAIAGSCTIATSTFAGAARIVVARVSPLISRGDALRSSALSGAVRLLSGVNSGSPIPAIVRPSIVTVPLSSTLAFGCRATAAWIAMESWLPRT